MAKPRRRKWHVRRADCGLFDLKRFSTNCVECYTLKAALRYCRKVKQLGATAVLEKWVYLSKRSPKHPKGTSEAHYTVYEYTIT